MGEFSGVMEEPMANATNPRGDGENERAIFGRNFRARREMMSLTHRDILRLTGVGLSHIREIEAGDRNVAFDTMQRLAAITKTELWRLLKP